MRQILILSLVALCAAFVLSACSSVDQGAMKRSLFVDQHPELPSTMADAIRDGQITVGMTQEMVQVAWGKPVRTVEVQQVDAVSEWTYGNYFMGGNITNLYFDPAGLLVRYEVNYQPASANGGNVAIESPNQPGYQAGADGSISKNGGQP
jgi:outer membrane protein assembly factor BamE (lipoprotein component of BamABCDE complex)